MGRIGRRRLGSWAAAGVALPLAALGAVAACESGEEQSAASQQCPPAPLVANYPDACTFPKEGCDYDPPILLGPRKFLCEGVHLRCVDGAPLVAAIPPCIGADPFPTCPAQAAIGAPCTLTPAAFGKIGNGECYILGPSVDLDAGTGEVQVCACDQPGPVWRCAPWKLEGVQDGGGEAG